jgi:hypothetical protein
MRFALPLLLAVAAVSGCLDEDGGLGAAGPDGLLSTDPF